MGELGFLGVNIPREYGGVGAGKVDALIVLGLILAVQQLEGNVLQPWLQSKSMQLQPLPSE